MIELFKLEMSRNLSAYFLALLGVLTVVGGGHMHFDKMTDLGIAFATASLVAFQGKRTPDGNTTTTQVTVPPPEVVAPPASASSTATR